MRLTAFYPFIAELLFMQFCIGTNFEPVVLNLCAKVQGQLQTQKATATCKLHVFIGI